ncbi:hypothetical protein QTP86_031472, partial [Hemibagrus guttatus]
IDTFPGKCSYTWEYKDPHSFLEKRVVVIGTGNSGGDIAVEISRVAEKTFLSMREGVWVMGRMSTSGLPWDMNFITRLNTLLLQVFPQTGQWRDLTIRNLTIGCTDCSPDTGSKQLPPVSVMHKFTEKDWKTNMKRVLFSLCTPYQFQLSGPGRGDGAHQAILTQWERVAEPFKTRPIPEDKTSTLHYWLDLAGGVMQIFLKM